MRRSTVILLVLFILLAALTWYMQQPGNRVQQALATSTTQASASGESLVDPNKGYVSAFQIENATGKSLKVEKNNNLWTVNDGKDGPADQSLAASAAGQVFSMTVVSRLDKAPDPAATGLDKQDYTVSVTQPGGIVHFTIGKLTATGSGYYVRLDGGAVVIANKEGVEAFVASLANPPLPPTATPAASLTPYP